MNSRKLAGLVFAAALTLAGWLGFYWIAPDAPVWLGLCIATGMSVFAWLSPKILLSMPLGFRWLTIGAAIALAAFWLYGQSNTNNPPWWIAAPGMFGLVWFYLIRKKRDVSELGKRDVWIALGWTALLAVSVAGFLAIGKYFQNQATNRLAVEELIRWE